MVKIRAVVSFLSLCLLHSVSTQLVYGNGRVITSYQFGGGFAHGITIAYRPQDDVKYAQSTTGVVGLAKIIYTQASTYAGAKQARERLSFVNDGNVLTWDNPGRYYYYQSEAYTLRIGLYISAAVEFHDRQGRAIYHHNETWAVSHAVDCWVDRADYAQYGVVLTECKTVFDNEAIWPTYAPTTVRPTVTTPLPSNERTTNEIVFTTRQRAIVSGITTLSPKITPPWTEAPTVTQSIQPQATQHTSPNSAADVSSNTNGPVSGFKPGNEGAVSEKQEISTGVLVTAITVPFVVIIIIVIAVAVICVKRKLASASNTNQPPPIRYDRQNGGQVNPVMIPAVSGNYQPDPNKHSNYQPSVTPQQQNLYQPLNSYSQMSSPYVQPISDYSSPPTQSYGYSYVPPNSNGPQAFAPVNRPGNTPVRRPPPPQHMPSKARPSTHRVMHTFQTPGSESGYEYEGPQAPTPEETTSNYYTDIVLTDEAEYSVPDGDM